MDIEALREELLLAMGAAKHDMITFLRGPKFDMCGFASMMHDLWNNENAIIENFPDDSELRSQISKLQFDLMEQVDQEAYHEHIENCQSQHGRSGP